MDFTAPTHTTPRPLNQDNAPRFGAAPRFESHSKDYGGLQGSIDPIEELQLSRLANAILSKSPADLAALSEANPQLFWEWIEAFAHKKREADTACHLWAAAMACLATTSARDTLQQTRTALRPPAAE